MVKAHDVFPNESDPDAKVKEVHSWLQKKGVRDFEPVSLFCDQLKKVSTILQDFLILDIDALTII